VIDLVTAASQQLASDDSSLDVGSALIAGAAAFAALLATISASLRQKAQLRHERELREREHTRDMLDAQVDEVQESLRAIVRFKVVLNSGEKPYHEDMAAVSAARSSESDAGTSEVDVRDAEGRIKKTTEIWDAARQKSHEARLARRAGTTRLRLRLGRNATIVRLHDQFVAAYSDLHGSIAKGVVAVRDEAEKSSEKEAYAKMKKAYQGFLRACEAWFSEGIGRREPLVIRTPFARARRVRKSRR